MRALVFDGTELKYKPFHPDPVPAADEALVQVQLAGVCRTDTEICRGYMNFKGVLGHEFVGTVTRCADRKWVGKRVVGEINCVCSKCDMCLSGLAHHCRQRTVLGIQKRDGCFADLVALPIRNLHLVPPSVAIEQAVWVEPLAAALQVTLQCKIDARSRVTILGDGRLGLLVALVLKRTGCKLQLVGRHPEKLSIADRLGVQSSLQNEFSPKRDQDVVIDCTGRPDGFDYALQVVRPRGTIVLKTTVAGPSPVNLSALVVDELTVLGSRCGPFREALALLESRQVDVSAIAARRVKISQGEEACKAATGGDGAVKALLTFDK